MDIDILTEEVPSESLKRRIHNQRKQLRHDQGTINDLKASLAFTDSELSLSEHDRLSLLYAKQELENRLDQLSRRYSVLKKKNARHLGKLVALNHVMQRQPDSDDEKADDLLQAVTLR